MTDTDIDWRQKLTPEQYEVTREKGTERPYSGKYNSCDTPGVYHCICCGEALFDSANKFDSGTGWPSYWAPVEAGAVRTETDSGLFSTRTEVLCAKCGSHLGHVFDDGPRPTGQRYCINSVSLKLEPRDE
jgi:peptide-methionine (R)-S-oxide reductase